MINISSSIFNRPYFFGNPLVEETVIDDTDTDYVPRSYKYNTDLDNVEREENLNNFKSGNLNVLVSCTALDEGFDMPEADGAMILSASSSKRQRIQRMGRVLRSMTGKENAEVITIYATDVEEARLAQESQNLNDIVQINWKSVIHER